MKNYSEHLLAEVVRCLKAARQQKGMSHDVLAQKAGVSRPAISHIENGKRKPSLILCIKLAHALDIKLSDLIAQIEDSQPLNRP
jgi:DNA-binding XRE family transcriptional regulator